MADADTAADANLKALAQQTPAPNLTPLPPPPHVVEFAVVDATQIQREKNRVINIWAYDRGQGFCAFLVSICCSNRLLVKFHVVLIRYSPDSGLDHFLAGLFTWLAILGWFGVDLYLILLLISVVSISNELKGIDSPLRLPDRGIAVWMYILFVFTLTFAFARINHAMGLTHTFTGSVWEAFLTVATFEHGHYYMGSIGAHAIVSLEISSALFLLFVFFPLLVARLAMFHGDTVAAKPLAFEARMASGETAIWKVADLEGMKPDHEADKLSFTVTGTGSVKISSE